LIRRFNILRIIFGMKRLKKEKGEPENANVLNPAAA
jgi:hypothetical protein